MGDARQGFDAVFDLGDAGRTGGPAHQEIEMGAVSLCAQKP